MTKSSSVSQLSPEDQVKVYEKLMSFYANMHAAVTDQLAFWHVALGGQVTVEAAQ